MMEINAIVPAVVAGMSIAVILLPGMWRMLAHYGERNDKAHRELRDAITSTVVCGRGRNPTFSPPRVTVLRLQDARTFWPAPVQVSMPIRADGRRGSDRIRFRVWQDPRLTGLVQTVLVVISEFVNQSHAARLKGRTIADCAHMSVERCLKATNTAADLGVLAIDRRSHHRRYVFLDSWLRWFGDPAATPERHDDTSSHRPERHDDTSSHRPERHDDTSSHRPERHDVSSSHD